MKQFEIVLVSFPQTDLSQTKIRPALILAEIPGENTILCQITSRKGSLVNYEIFIPVTSTNLNLDSYVNVDMIFTLKKRRILRKIGSVEDTKIQQEILKKLSGMFNLPKYL